jgi:hypothetical protein
VTAGTTYSNVTAGTTCSNVTQATIIKASSMDTLKDLTNFKKQMKDDFDKKFQQIEELIETNKTKTDSTINILKMTLSRVLTLSMILFSQIR